MQKESEMIRSKIWKEEAETDNPFAAKACYCHGYDVYGDLLGKISWPEYIYLLFKGEAATKNQADYLERISIILANPGLRDHSVRAAMNSGVGGSTSASSLIAAIATGSGNLNGGREIYIAIRAWEECGQNIDNWKAYFKNLQKNNRVGVWKDIEHPPGFDLYGVSCATPVKQALESLKENQASNNISWLHKNRSALESIVNCPLSITGVIAAAFFDLEMSAEKSEILYMILRLPGAAAHSLEQKRYGWKHFPFFKNGITLIEKNDK